MAIRAGVHICEHGPLERASAEHISAPSRSKLEKEKAGAASRRLAAEVSGAVHKLVTKAIEAVLARHGQVGFPDSMMRPPLASLSRNVWVPDLLPS